MRFRQLDRILCIEPGVRIVAAKTLAPAEDYLRDHFPRFPVMPGVLMLEAMFQAGVWLAYQSDDFQRSMVVLKETRNVKFADFVTPGRTLVVTAELVSQGDNVVKLKTHGALDESVAVSGRLVLERFNWSDRNPDWAAIDRSLRRDMRRQYRGLIACHQDEPAPA
jgi:3-hydroxyacyl-[acyl-carrier-protein] dehydratase